jgi:predicted O-linked N-acetylglucosamine transferase (SPINDLY family)
VRADEFHVKGLLKARAGQFERAKSLIGRALELEPTNIQFRENYATVLCVARNYGAAVDVCDDGIRLNTAHAGLLYISAIALFKLRRLRESLERFDRLLARQPNHLIAINERGAVLAEMKQYAPAIAAFQNAISLNPSFADAHINLGNAFGALERDDDAAAAFSRGLALSPQSAPAWLGLGNVLRKRRAFDDALAAFDKALALQPDLSGGWLGRANVYFDSRQYDDALAAYDRALHLQSNLVEALWGRGHVLHALKRHADAASGIAALLNVDPEYPFAKGMLLHESMMMCDWRNVEVLTSAIGRDIESGKPSAEPFVWHAISHSPRSLRRCAEIYSTTKFPPNITITPRPPAHQKIRVGYVGDVFREQAVSYLLVGALEHADKSVFELYGFDNGWNDGSETRRRLESVLTMVDIRSRDDLSAAAAIREREIDILVNLNVFIGGHRNGVFAKRPAPIQVNYLGFPATLGASYSDYIIGDRIVIPPDDRDYYTEKVIYLPHCYLPSDRTTEIAPASFTRAQFGLPANGFVFCCFNNTFKITPEVFDSWMRILKSTTGSVLWLLEDNSSVAANLRTEARARGVDPARLILAKRMKLGEHLARHRLADLFVDTLPYNAHTTAIDALWAGLPVLTQRGPAFPGRVAASLLHAVGLPELITENSLDYERLAVALAANPDQLAILKCKLAQNRLAMPLFNTALYARHLDAGYAAMHQRWRTGLPPDHIAVTSDLSIAAAE